jgi:hypothetical protein
MQSIDLGPIYDPDYGQTVSSTFMVIPPTTQIALKDGVLDIAKIRPGNYSVTITLKDSSAYNPGVSVYTLYL